jgi:zinc/manganese transport system permease protein
MAPALLAGAIVLATHVPLGREVLARGIIFLDLAVAQMAGLGVIVTGTLGWHVHGLPAQLSAFAAALIGALLLYAAERRFRDHLEAVIGVVFVLAATGGILLLANNPRGGEELKDLLIGQILWVDAHTLLPALGVSVVVLLALWHWAGRLRGLGFYLLFALSVTVSVQLVGIFLVFASLIVPALAARRHPRHGLAVAYAVGVLGYGTGLTLSALLDLPTGAVIVWCLTLWAVIMELVPDAKP